MLMMCVLFAPADAAERGAVTVSVSDALTTPGRPVMLEARVLQAGTLMQAGLGGERVEFSIGGKSIGTAMTGGDGRALLEYTPKMRGNLSLSVRVQESARVPSGEATGTVFSWERRRPILLVEMEALVERVPTPTLPLPLLPGSPVAALSARPQPDAADELKRLTDFYYNVVYMVRTKGPALSDGGEVREWLRASKFPPGFIVRVGSGQEALEEAIQTLRAEGWDNLKAGIGRTVEFAGALLAQRLEVVIVLAPEHHDFPRKAQIAASWKDVRKKRL